MVKTSNTSISDDELISIVNTRLDGAVGGNLDSLTTVRAEATMLYEGALPRKRPSDHTRYVSQDVLEAVEERKATLLETFTGNVKPVQFVATTPQDLQEAEQATAYVDNVMFNQNDGYYILHDVIHDGLIARVGITQTWWDANIIKLPQAVSLPDVNTAAAYLQQLNPELVDDMDIDINQDTGECRVEYNEIVDKGQVRVEVVPPEEFWISPRATSLDEADILARRQMRSWSEMKQNGYDVGDPKEWGDQNFNATDTDYSKAVRFWDIDGGLPVTSGDSYHKKIAIADCYVKIDRNNNTELWHVVMSASRILHKEQIKMHPFDAFVPLRIPHRFYGLSFATLLKATQENNTYLTRSIINHALITTNPRWGILRGALPFPKELVDNRLGGIVNMSRPDAIQPLNQPNLNPFVFQTVEKLTNDKEVITGTTALSQGLNKDAVSSQNSADLVSQMASMGMQRAKMMARNMERFFASLYKRIYQLVIENEKAQRIIEVSGNFVVVDPSKWSAGRDVHVKFSIGYGEREKDAMRLQQFDEYMSAQQGAGGMYGIQQRYNVWTDILAAFGHQNVNRYLVPPQDIPPQQPDPQQLFEANIKNRETAVKEQMANTAAMKAQAHAQLQAENAERKQGHLGTQSLLKAQEMQYRAENDQQKNLLDAARLHAQVQVDGAELNLAKKAQHIQATAKPIPINNGGS